MSKDEAEQRLKTLKRLRARAKAAQKAATEATEPTVLYALEQGLGPALISELGGVSDGYVRGVRRAHELPANPSYAGLKPPTRTKRAEGGES